MIEVKLDFRLLPITILQLPVALMYKAVVALISPVARFDMDFITLFACNI